MNSIHPFARRALLALVRYVGITVLLATFPLPVQGQDAGPWKGKRGAVVLTYDDALDVHLDAVVPALDSLGLKATFYVPGFSPGFRARIKDWRGVAREGHELGNHTLYHPCEGKAPGREWVPPDYDLSRYTVRRMVDEIVMANALLEAVDGKARRTFAYPCGDMQAGDSSYVEQVRRIFPAARGVGRTIERMDDVDLSNIGACIVQEQSADDLVALVDEAVSKSALVVFLFHGVGGGHAISASTDAHRMLLRSLREREDAIWVAPLREVAEFVRDHRADMKRTKSEN
jgi:peptidoglycan/xylan/chitin deacetylase (PgdA/CDA1 family)